MNNEFLIDLHTHTLMSGHAYHTLTEMIDEAINLGMDLIAITEHGPNMPNSCNDFYFSNYRVLQKNHRFEELPIYVKFGIEANICDEHGTLDIDLDEKSIRECMDIVIASVHNCTFPDNSLIKTQSGILRAIENPYVDIIGHPDDRDFDYNEIVCAAKEYSKILELNNSSNNPYGFRRGARERDLVMLDLCKSKGVAISLASDAHSKYDIGNFEYILPILKEVDFPKELIVNSSLENYYKYLNKIK